MKNTLLLLLTASLFTSYVNAVSAKKSPEDIPSGPYQQTCKGILVTDDGTEDFSAACPDNKGKTWVTHFVSYPELPPEGWENLNGNLWQQDAVPGGPWLQTCSGSVYDAAGYPLPSLTASCLTPDGTYNKSMINISAGRQAYNDNGVLECVGDDCGFHK